MSISLSLNNPKAKGKSEQAVLYLGEANTLDLVFTKKGNVRNPKAGDTFKVVFPKPLLASASKANLGSSDWTATVTADDDNYTFKFKFWQAYLVKSKKG